MSRGDRSPKSPLKADDHAHVVAVSSSAQHTFTKPERARIRLVAGLGVEGDAHAGTTVKHRSRVERDASRPNLRQVHLIQAELHDELAGRGYTIGPGRMGENITTRGIDLLALPTGALLLIGDAVIEVTGLRDPCLQLEQLGNGLMQAVLDRDAEGALVRKAGIMAVVLQSGEVRTGQMITVKLPPLPHRPLLPV